TNVLAQSRYTTNQIYLNGSGVAAGDVDGDGWCDLYFCSLAGSNVLYRNFGGFHFTNVTESAGVACPGLSSTGAAFADLDGDGDLDLIVNTIGGGTHIFLNDGKGHLTQTATLNEGKGGMSIAIADYDGDGALDIYICNYRTTTLRDMPSTNFRINMIDGKPVVASVNGEPTTLPQYEGRFALNSSGNVSEFGEADALYHNDGHGRFTRVSFTDGTFLDEDGKPLQRPPYDWSLSAMFRDLNGDGRPDLYVCSDFDTPDRIWINQGGGKFKAIAKLALRNTSRFSMGVDVADINRDGHDDIFVADMLSRDHVTRLTRADKRLDSISSVLIEGRPQFSRNTLQLNRGDGTYAEIAFFAGLEASEWSWTPAFLDVDLDGFEDLLITTGHGRDDMDLDTGLQIERTRRATKMTPMAELAMRKNTRPLPGPKLAFRNAGALHFENVSETWGFNQIGISHGMCMADLDNDGDLDLVVNNLNAPAGIYRNETIAGRVSVHLKGDGKNTLGIGAKIKALGGPVPFQTQEIICGGRYLACDEPVRVFAAGKADALRVEVTWRSGKQTVAESVPANSAIEIFESAASQTTDSHKPTTALFEDATGALKHEHHEDSFDDFAGQSLLPKKFSQLGPGVSWIDLDRDGREDLVIGSGKGGALAIFHNDGEGKFTLGPNFTEKLQRDSSGIVGSGSQIFVAFANYEDGTTNGACIQQYETSARTKRDVLPAQTSSIGPIAMADVDGDGALELFAGGRTLPGRYPEAALSFLLRQENGQWLLDPQTALFKDIGMVSAGVWTDLNGDGFPELVLACEWGPIKIFWNEKGRLRDATAELQMGKRIGWWNGVAA
ncbi:MAG TPA: VCBS repeat-containing protein, partial [Verrucomicrobiae bacterium]